MGRVGWWLALWVACGSAGAALAAAPSAYVATAPVAGTSDAARNAAIESAFATVLHTLAPTLVATPDVLGRASGLVRTFHYSKAPAGGLQLEVDFDPGSVDRLVARTGAGTASTPTPAPAPTGPASAAPAGAPATAVAVPVAAAQPGGGILWVGGVNDAHAFAGLLAALRGDSDLSNVQPVAADGNGVLLKLDSDRPLTQALAGLTGPAGHLAPAATPHASADASMTWVP